MQNLKKRITRHPSNYKVVPTKTYYKNLQTIIELGTIILIHVKGYEMFTEFENSKMNIKDFLELMIKFHQTKILIVSYFACTLMSYRQKIC